MRRNKKQVVFFSATTPYVMIYKIAREFKKKGYETVLITISQNDKWEREWYKDGFDKIICSNFQIFKPTPKKLLGMIKRLPYLIKSLFQMSKLKPWIVFSIAKPNYIAAMAMKYFQKKCPVIYFPYDVNSSSYLTRKEALREGVKSFEIDAERYCFENADGIMHMGSPEELEHLKKRSMLGKPVNIKVPVITFHPYCSDEFMVPINENKYSKEDNEKHIVFAGGLFGSKECNESYIFAFKNLLKQKIHIHLYAKTQHLSKKEEDKKISKNLGILFDNKRFHVEYALPPKKLIPEMSKCDYGFSIDPFKVRCHKFLMGNKFASYLEAGIPSFYPTTYERVDKIMKKYGLSLKWDANKLEGIKDIKKRIQEKNYRELIENVKKARKDYNMKNYFPRLEKFIKRVICS